MSIQLNEENGGKILVVHVSGKLAAADYEHFVPEFDRLVRLHGKLQVLFDMTGLHGWDRRRVVGGHEVCDASLQRHRSPGGGRREEMAGRDGNVLQAIHEGDDPILRSRRCR